VQAPAVLLGSSPRRPRRPPTCHSRSLLRMRVASGAAMSRPPRSGAGVACAHTPSAARARMRAGRRGGGVGGRRRVPLPRGASLWPRGDADRSGPRARMAAARHCAAPSRAPPLPPHLTPALGSGSPAAACYLPTGAPPTQLPLQAQQGGALHAWGCVQGPARQCNTRHGRTQEGGGGCPSTARALSLSGLALTRLRNELGPEGPPVAHDVRGRVVAVAAAARAGLLGGWRAPPARGPLALQSGRRRVPLNTRARAPAPVSHSTLQHTATAGERLTRV
jgi:hypothetical protein